VAERNCLFKDDRCRHKWRIYVFLLHIIPVYSLLHEAQTLVVLTRMLIEEYSLAD
jgi:hypothetical protein